MNPLKNQIWLISWIVALMTFTTSVVILLVLSIRTIQNEMIFNFWKSVFEKSYWLIITFTLAKINAFE